MRSTSMCLKSFIDYFVLAAAPSMGLNFLSSKLEMCQSEASDGKISIFIIISDVFFNTIVLFNTHNFVKNHQIFMRDDMFF